MRPFLLLINICDTLFFINKYRGCVMILSRSLRLIWKPIFCAKSLPLAVIIVFLSVTVIFFLSFLLLIGVLFWNSPSFPHICLFFCWSFLWFLCKCIRLLRQRWFVVFSVFCFLFILAKLAFVVLLFSSFSFTSPSLEGERKMLVMGEPMVPTIELEISQIARNS